MVEHHRLHAWTIGLAVFLGLALGCSDGGSTSRPAVLSVSAPSFGSALIGASADQTITVTNGGDEASGALVISISDEGDDFTRLAPAGGECEGGVTVLPAGGRCTFRVRFVPIARGARSATLTVNATPGDSASATLSGTGLQQATLTSAVESHAFGAQETGTTSAAWEWTITNGGDVPSGVPQLTLRGTHPEEFDGSGCTGALDPGASCTVSVTFTPSALGPFGATVGASAAPGGSVTLDASGDGGARIEVVSIGTGRITLEPSGIDCSEGCTTYVDLDGATITLQARTTNGSGHHFSGWTGACSGAARDCTVTADASRSVTATFSPIDHNLVFLSSVAYATNLGGATAYDARCNELATSAGINDLSNDAYVAWVSTTSSHVSTRLGPARGFVRVDGKPVGDQVNNLLSGGNKILHAISLDENGANPGTQQVLTGTPFDGTPPSHDCAGFTSAAGSVFFTYGSSAAGPKRWTSYNSLDCARQARIYCFMKTKTSELIPAVSPGKKIWVSDEYVPSASETPDAECAAKMPAGVSSASALVATTTTPASAALDAAQTYVRPDGQVVGSHAELVAAGALRTGPWQQADGTYVAAPVWTGYDGVLTRLAPAGTTCSNWTSSTADQVAHGGDAGFVIGWWAWQDNASCAETGRRLICVEQ